MTLFLQHCHNDNQKAKIFLLIRSSFVCILRAPSCLLYLSAVNEWRRNSWRVWQC